MITAEEARKRADNISMLNSFRISAERQIKRSVEIGLYETKFMIGDAMPEYVIDEISKELRDLGYKVTYTKDKYLITGLLGRKTPNTGTLNISW